MRVNRDCHEMAGSRWLVRDGWFEMAGSNRPSDTRTIVGQFKTKRGFLQQKTLFRVMQRMGHVSESEHSLAKRQSSGKPLLSLENLDA